MIKSVTFKKDFRCFKAEDKFNFRPGTNVLVGDQGSGKSTLIELLRIFFEPKISKSDSSWRAKNIEVKTKDVKEVIDVDSEDKTKILAVDFERESVRDMSQILGDQMGLQMFGMRSSHGQSNMAMLTNFLEKIIKNKDKVDTVLMDEPDASLSPRSCYLLLQCVYQLTNKFDKQTIISAHNPILIEGVHPLIVGGPLWDEVLSLEHKQWMPSKSFFINQVLPREEDKPKPEPKKKKIEL